MGGGSWATAIAKILLSTEDSINWYIRRDDRIADFKRLGHNPAYLTGVQFDVNRIKFSSDINQIVNDSEVLVFVTPSPYFKSHMKKLKVKLKDKFVVSAIKGTIPDCCLSVSMYLREYFGVSRDAICVVSGPSHAEEVCREMPTFLTLASSNIVLANEMACMLRCNYLHTTTTTDIDGVERCGLGKNIYAIAAGLCQGLDYGDNLNAVLTAAAMREMHNMLDHSMPCPDRNIYDNYYMGDLVVTCWSHHSRNRALGEAVARGERPEEVFARTGSVAEGYYSVKNLHQLACEYGIQHVVPIAEAVYRILYEGADPKSTVKHLIDTVF